MRNSTMARLCGFQVLCIWIAISSVTLSSLRTSANEERKVHIVYLGALPEGDYSPEMHHFDLLRKVVDSRFLKQSLVRSYLRSFNAFAANLTAQESEKLAKFDEVVSVFPSQILQPQTTRSWDFMGFRKNVPRNPTVESNVIIGVIDTGIWPESESFSDTGFGPIPKKWKGACKGGHNFTCNNKLIGARYYSSGESTRDGIGHGSHTASTAAGNLVKDASFYGIAQGTARGAVPSARIAAYSVCDSAGCPDEDILGAFDDAIADGVDIITISIGARVPRELQNDPIAIGSFHAMEKSILTMNSAGNEGPNSRTISSIAPWFLSVAATTTDRRIISKVVLGNGSTIIGNAVNCFKLNGTKYPLISPKDAQNGNCPGEDPQFCQEQCLRMDFIRGKILLCQDSINDFQPSFDWGVAATIIAQEETEISYILPSPASAITSKDILLVRRYINSSTEPVADVLKSESMQDQNAPTVVFFSSRGPNVFIPYILKPDVAAPGVDILAAYSPVAPVTRFAFDRRSVKYKLVSGTSMSCPHVAGAAAYIKSFHPDWSPSAIKSALMTTAWGMNSARNSDAEFSYGSGHIDPRKATNPGLVYEISPDDYIKLLCGLGYGSSTVSKISGTNISCTGSNKIKPKDLNYPSMTIPVNSSSGVFSAELIRTVTNIGSPRATYKAKITKTSDCNISVEPSVLTFGALNERKSFVVKVSGKVGQKIISASLEWSDGVHNLRSPIVVYSLESFG